MMVISWERSLKLWPRRVYFPETRGPRQEAGGSTDDSAYVHSLRGINLQIHFQQVDLLWIP